MIINAQKREDGHLEITLINAIIVIHGLLAINMPARVLIVLMERKGRLSNE